MAQTIKFDFSNTEFMASKEDVAAMSDRVVAAKKTLF